MTRLPEEPFVLLARRHGPVPAPTRAPADPGGRRVVLSWNGALALLAGWVLALLGAFVAGKAVGRAHTPPLVTTLRRYRAVQVTPLLDENRYRARAWALRDQLVRAGFPDAAVLRQVVRGESKVRTIAGKVPVEDRSQSEALAARVRQLLPRLRKLVPDLPLEVRSVVIVYRPPGPAGR